MAEKSSFWTEFKTFIARGNVMDMAVGVVVGGAFTAIVNSLVGDIINPLIAKLFGKTDLKEVAKIVLTEANEAEGVAEVAIRFGAFIHAIINFLIVALCIFTVVRTINKLKEAAKKKEEEEKKEEEKPAEPSEDILLLREIRDALAEKKEE